MKVTFLDRTAKIYDYFMKKDHKAYKQMYSLIYPVVRHKQVLELATGTAAICFLSVRLAYQSWWEKEFPQQHRRHLWLYCTDELLYRLQSGDKRCGNYQTAWPIGNYTCHVQSRSCCLLGRVCLWKWRFRVQRSIRKNADRLVWILIGVSPPPLNRGRRLRYEILIN